MGAAVSCDGNSQRSIDKINGDNAFRAGLFPEAIAYYTKEIIKCMDGPKEGLKIDAKYAAILYSNRSASYESCFEYEKALNDALDAIAVFPQWYKGYYRAAKASIHLTGGIKEAQDFLSKAVALCTEDLNVTELQTQLLTDNQTKSRGEGWILSWGSGAAGQLGHKNINDKSLPTVIDELRGKHVADVACGASHTVAVMGTGEVYAWGDNTYHQCGISGMKDEPRHFSPKIISKLLGISIVAISCGSGHSVAVASDGRVFSWGVGRQGQLGHGAERTNEIEPKEIENLEGSLVKAVACGISHTLFLMENGAIKGCGSNEFGQLGFTNTGNDTYIGTPTDIPRGVSYTTAISHVACGGGHSCIIDEDGLIFSCGLNSCGQLGHSRGENCEEFKLVHTLQDTRCAFIACGEEFTAVVTKDKQDVFCWGLGIVGQLGNGLLNSSETPVRVVGVSGIGIETLVCSQGQVLAITTGGEEVWTWGLPGDRAHQASLDPSVIIKVPEKVAAFGKRKRIRQLCCGRKHYVLLTIGTYGPNCSIIKGITKNTPNVITAGKRKAFTIQSRDSVGQIATTGGAVFNALLSMQDADDPKVVLGLCRNARTQTKVEIDDDFNGQYSGSIHCNLTGSFLLYVSLDGLDIEDSPFEVVVEAAEPYAPCCEIHWLMSGGIIPMSPAPPEGKEEEETNSRNIRVEGSEVISFDIILKDRFGNLCGVNNNNNSNSYSNNSNSNSISNSNSNSNSNSSAPTTARHDVITVRCKHENGKVQFQKDFGTCHKGVYSCMIRAPAHYGAYDLDIGINGIDDLDQLLVGSPFQLIVSGGGVNSICPRKCVVTCEEEVVAGEKLIVLVELRDLNGDYIFFRSSEEELATIPKIINSTLQPLMHSLSARAQINNSNSKNSTSNSNTIDFLSPQQCIKKRRLPGPNCIVECHHIPWIAGENKLTVEAANQEEVLLRTLITVIPSKADAGYTEILQLGKFLEDCADAGFDETKTISAIIQARDKFGNLCRTGGAALSLYALCISTANKVYFSITDRQDGTYVATLTAPLVEKMEHEIHFFVGEMAAKYSPFSIIVGNLTSAVDLTKSITLLSSDSDSNINPGEIINTQHRSSSDISALLSNHRNDSNSGYNSPSLSTLPRDVPSTVLFQRQHSTVPSAESQAERELLDKWKREQMTRSRAAAVLRQERSKLSREKETRLLRAKAKRTGGGFIVQYSRDI